MQLYDINETYLVSAMTVLNIETLPNSALTYSDPVVISENSHCA